MVLPLEDIRIIDLGRILPTPFPSKVLADMGADVIKVEPFEMFPKWLGKKDSNLPLRIQSPLSYR